MASLKAALPGRRDTRAHGLFDARLVLAIVIAALPTGLRAEIAIEGGPDAVRLVADQASLDEVLASLDARFGLRYRASTTLDQPVTGTYRGPLRRVVGQLLAGYNFVLKTSAGSVELVVLGPNQGGSYAAARPVVVLRPQPVQAAKPPAASAPAVSQPDPAAADGPLERLRRSLGDLWR